MKKNFFIILVFILCVIFNDCTLAYDTYTHSYLTREAVGLYNQNFPDKQIPRELISYLLEGAQREDDPPRWMNHFYDPVYNRGYEVDFKIDNTLPFRFVKIVTDLGSWLSSKDWAISNQEQNRMVYKVNFYHAATILTYNEKSKLDTYYYDTDFTYQTAKNLWLQGEKEKAMFALGHILHLIEDSAVPDHTRDDGHIGDSPYELFTAQYNLNNPDIKLTENLKNQKPVILSNLNSYFESLANYSNNNFYSKDTIGIQSGYKNPEPISQIIQNGIYYLVKLDENSNNLILAHNKNPQTFLISNSLFLELSDRYDLVLTDYWNHLAPKAVTYSSGVINLFFNEVQNQVALEPEEKSWYDNLLGTLFYNIGILSQEINNLFSNQSSIDYSVDNEIVLVSPNPSVLISPSISPLVSVSPNLENKNLLLNSPTPSPKLNIAPSSLPSSTPINSIIPSLQPNVLIVQPDGPRSNNQNLEISPLPSPALIPTPIPIPDFITIPTSTPETTSIPEISPSPSSLPTSTNPYFSNVKVYFDESSYQEEGGVLTIELEINQLINEFDIHNFVIGFNSEFVKSDGYCHYYQASGSKPSIISSGVKLKYQLPYTAILENSQYNQRCLNSAYCLTDSQSIQLPLKVKIQPNFSNGQNGFAGHNVYTKKFLEQVLGREINSSDFITIAYSPNLEIDKLYNHCNTYCCTFNYENFDFNYYNNLFPKPDNTHYYLLETSQPRFIIPYPSPYPVNSIIDLHWGKNASSSTGYSLEIQYQLPILSHSDPNNSINSFLWYFPINNYIPYNMSCSDLNNLSSCDFNYAKSYEIENSFLNLYHEGWQWSNGLKFCFDSDYACSASPYNWGAIYNYLLPHNQHPSTTPYILRFDIKPPSNIQLDKDSYLTVSNWQYGYNRDKTDLNFHLRELDSRKWYFEEGFVPWPEPILSSSPEPNSSSTSETIPEATSTPVATSTVATTSTSTNAKLEVVINEIAWMGTNASHSDEWIELYNNTSEEIDLNNWVLKSASGSPSTTLIGKIPANGFYLLERTSSTTISNIIEDQIFTGVLNNNCEVLELIDSSGNLQDKTICNGNYWPAGENQTGVGKDTIRASMERINPNISGEILKNWKTNNQININGLDAGNNPILGTPKAPNSCYLNSS